MAFYRIESGSLIKSEDSLFGPGFDLLVQDHDTYEYPIYGWYWFDTDEEAQVSLNADS